MQMPTGKKHIINHKINKCLGPLKIRNKKSHTNKQAMKYKNWYA